ncbi:MAG: glycerophosphodiester phosphodiesterase family protein [Gammaproteobacteria bacterium]|nr:glycerophosphodiester phosphodiesterase family protein [Gammaproteobacteria bacterium]
MVRIRPEHAPQIHGHRGARGLFPENSLVAIQSAVQCGCDAIEVDLCISADDQVVVHHDPVLSPCLVRGPGGRWIEEEIRVRELTVRELQSFDIGRIRPGTEYGTTFRHQQPVDGTTIPTLEECVRLVDRLQADILFNLELKSTPLDPASTPPMADFARIVAAELNRLDLVEHAFVQSFDWRLPRAVQRLVPGLKIGFTTGLEFEGKPDAWTDYHDLKNFNAQIPVMVKALGAHVWSSDHRCLTRSEVALAHDLGLELNVWTVNTTRDMEKWIEWEADAITTDYPDHLHALLTRGQ